MRYVELKVVGSAADPERTVIRFPETELLAVVTCARRDGTRRSEVQLYRGCGPFLVEGTASEVWAEIQRQLDAQKPVFAEEEANEEVGARPPKEVKLRRKIRKLEASLQGCRAEMGKQRSLRVRAEQKLAAVLKERWPRSDESTRAEIRGLSQRCDELEATLKERDLLSSRVRPSRI